MDMHINKEFLRQEREQRGWTQSHLAEVADLSLRTVQRIEANGVASKESAMALACALEMSLPKLLLEPSQPIAGYRYSQWWNFAGIATLLLATLGWWSTASAEQLMLNLSVNTASGSAGDMQLSNEVGQQSEIKFEEQFRLLVTTKRQDQHLLISTEVYDFVDGKYQLISTPAILVADNESAGISLNTQSSGQVDLKFTVDY